MARYYRNNYRRAYATTSVSDGRDPSVCSVFQEQRITKEVTYLSEHIDKAPPSLQAAIQSLVDAIPVEGWLYKFRNDPTKISKVDASSILDRLIPATELLANDDTVRAVIAADEAAKYRGLPAHERTMPTKFDGKCVSCGTTTVAGTDLAVLVAGRWQAWCQSCATTDPAERQARVDAERAALDAEAARVAAESKRLFDLCCQVVAESATDASKPVIGVAIPSKGENDLDFLKVTHDGRVYRVIGGHPDQRLAVDQAVTLVERVLAFGVRDAIVRYGHELELCGVCGRHLTDKESRQRGIGPICASRW